MTGINEVIVSSWLYIDKTRRLMKCMFKGKIEVKKNE